jgi:CRISPR system Cascade subunit CasB
VSEHAQAFIAHLSRVREQDRAAFAELRRSLSFAPGGYPPAYPYVECFAGSDRKATDSFRLALYLTAGLYAMNPRTSERSVASSLGDLMRNRESDSIEKRFIVLLGAGPESIPNYLRQIISLLAADDLGLDYAALLDDLARWLNPHAIEARDKIRQRWARDFYGALTPRKAEPEPISPETA